MEPFTETELAGWLRVCDDHGGADLDLRHVVRDLIARVRELEAEARDWRTEAENNAHWLEREVQSYWHLREERARLQRRHDFAVVTAKAAMATGLAECERLRAALVEEREACARLAHETAERLADDARDAREQLKFHDRDTYDNMSTGAEMVAAKIRARGEGR